MHPFVTEALSLVSPVLEGQFQTHLKVNPDSILFTEFGSDKNTRHSYGEIYFEILDQKVDPKILEIGVGSVNNFPYAGLAAGGALQALRMKYPGSEFVGLDIDPQSKEKIKKLK
jgi:hypothetical protein